MKRSILLVGALLLIAALYAVNQRNGAPPAEYNPQIRPADFSTQITNRYLRLHVGTQFIYEADTEDGTERIEILVTDRTKDVLGVETVVYWDRVTLNGRLIEDTRDYLAQDKDGNVWYFGEDVDNYENGTLKDHEGAWLAGVDGAKPGIWMKADPRIGDVYRQEYAAGVAEDMAEVLALGETVRIKDKEYTDCLKTYDYSPLIPTAKENKYYCPDVGGLVLEVDQVSGERAELLEVRTGVPTYPLADLPG